MVGQIQIVALQGWFAVADAARLERIFERADTKQVVNVEGLEGLSRPSFAAVVQARRRLDGLGGELVVSGVSPWLSNTLEVLGLEDEFRVFATDDQALSYLTEGAAEVPLDRVIVRPQEG